MLKKWWKYEKLKNLIKKKQISKKKILSLNSSYMITWLTKLNIFQYYQHVNKQLNCYPNICKSSRKFKKNIKMGKTTRWVFYHQLKKEKVANVYKYVW